MVSSLEVEEEEVEDEVWVVAVAVVLVVVVDIGVEVGRDVAGVAVEAFKLDGRTLEETGLTVELTRGREVCAESGREVVESRGKEVEADSVGAGTSILTVGAVHVGKSIELSGRSVGGGGESVLVERVPAGRVPAGRVPVADARSTISTTEAITVAGSSQRLSSEAGSVGSTVPAGAMTKGPSGS